MTGFCERGRLVKESHSRPLTGDTDYATSRKNLKKILALWPRHFLLDIYIQTYAHLRKQYFSRIVPSVLLLVCQSFLSFSFLLFFFSLENSILELLFHSSFFLVFIFCCFLYFSNFLLFQIFFFSFSFSSRSSLYEKINIFNSIVSYFYLLPFSSFN